MALVGGVSGFCVGVCQHDLLAGLFFSALLAAIGAFAGWTAASLVLFCLFLLLAICIPKARWILPIAAGIASAWMIGWAIVGGFDAVAAAFDFLIVFVVTVIACDAGISIAEFISRLVRGKQDAAPRQDEK
ncbi:hypothetical protein [Blastopirellula marina]|nr:hypothetical protein [Blastopirellula marina]